MPRQKTKSSETPDLVVNVFESIKLGLVRAGILREKAEHAQQQPAKLTDAVFKSHDILFKTKTIFPFTLFPDTVVLDREKVTIANRYFFWTERVTGTSIRDILSVEADVGPFFGSVHMSSRFFITNPYSVRFLKRRDAIKLRRLLQGYIIAYEQDIDCTKVPKTKLLRMLEELGKGDIN